MTILTRNIDAGSISTWFEMTEEAISKGKEARVPCEGCNAC